MLMFYNAYIIIVNIFFCHHVHYITVFYIFYFILMNGKLFILGALPLSSSNQSLYCVEVNVLVLQISPFISCGANIEIL